MADLAIGVTAELAEFKKAMSTLPGIGAAEARDMVAGIRRELKKAEAPAKATAVKIQQGFSNEFNKISGAAGNLASSLGGPFGTIGSLATGALKPIAELGATLGPAGAVGIGAAAAVLSIGGIGHALVSITNAAIEARDRLIEQGHAAEIPAESTESLREYEIAAAALRTEVDLLTVALGAELVPNLSRAATTMRVLMEASQLTEDALRGVGDEGRRTADIIDSWKGAADQMLPILVAVGTGGASVLMDKLKPALDEVVDAEIEATVAAEDLRLETEKAEEAYTAQLVALGMLDDGTVTHTANIRTNTAAKREANEVDEDAARIREELLGKNEDILEAEEKAAKAAAENAAKNRELYDEQTASLLALKPAFDEVGAAANDAANKMGDGWAEAGAAATDALSVTLAGVDQVIAAVQNYTDQHLANLQTRAQADGKITVAEEMQIQRAFEANQKFAKGVAIMDGARMAVSMIASLAPFMGPLAIPVGGGLAAAATLAQIATINAQSAPEFPTGMSPDHHAVSIQHGEGIASRRAMADPELRRALEEANGGRRSTPQGAQQQAVMVGVDPRLGRIRVTNDKRAGKRKGRR